MVDLTTVNTNSKLYNLRVKKKHEDEDLAESKKRLSMVGAAGVGIRLEPGLCAGVFDDGEHLLTVALHF